MKYNVCVKGVAFKDYEIKAENKSEAESEAIQLIQEEYGFFTFDSITADAEEVK
ncbi:MAG: hypothetical protein FWB73_00210 [Treponema sp.]|nr:hypothetical protein [Treponema sp.]